MRLPLLPSVPSSARRWLLPALLVPMLLRLRGKGEMLSQMAGDED